MYKKHLYLALVLLFFTVGLMNIDNIAITLWFNEHHDYALVNWIFIIFTHAGNGITLICITLFLYFIRPFKVFLTGVVGILLHAIVVYSAKNWIFSGDVWQRPLGILGEQLQLVPGIETHVCCTFPSGHTTSAFLLAGFLCMVFGERYEKKWWYLGYLYAFMVGLSRVYLLQHWVKDTTAGAVVGILSYLLARYMVERWGASFEVFDLLKRFRISNLNATNKTEREK